MAVLAGGLAGAVAGCAGPAMDFFAAPEPGWEPRPVERITVVVLGESTEGRGRLVDGLARAGRRHDVRLLPLEELLRELPDDLIAAGLDSAVTSDSAAATGDRTGAPDTTVLVRSDSGRTHRYGALASRAFREAGVEAVLEISLEAGGRIVDPGIEHTVRECAQWIESRGRLVCLRARDVTYRGDTLYRPWASYDVRLRDPETDGILWRGGAHSSGSYRRPAEMHRDLVREIVRELVEDGILPALGAGGSDGSERR